VAGGLVELVELMEQAPKRGVRGDLERLLRTLELCQTCRIRPLNRAMQQLIFLRLLPAWGKVRTDAALSSAAAIGAMHWQ
jgi:hypothetical protein